jgi:hypothetical protein
MSNTPPASVVPAKVVAVLLADGWHHVSPGSFTVGTLGFGTHDDIGMLGYSFEEADNSGPYGPAVLAGRLDALLAVRQVTPRGSRYRPCG